jgi:hypothetical protein
VEAAATPRTIDRPDAREYNSLLGWWWADPVVALVITAVAVKEGREAWRGDHCCVCCELHLAALGGALEVGQRHDSGVVEEDVQRSAPVASQSVHGLQVGKIEVFDRYSVVAGRLSNGCGDITSGLGIETARALASAGAEVTLAVRRPDAGDPANPAAGRTWDGAGSASYGERRARPCAARPAWPPGSRSPAGR